MPDHRMRELRLPLRSEIASLQGSATADDGVAVDMSPHSCSPWHESFDHAGACFRPSIGHVSEIGLKMPKNARSPHARAQAAALRISRLGGAVRRDFFEIGASSPDLRRINVVDH